MCTWPLHVSPKRLKWTEELTLIIIFSSRVKIGPLKVWESTSLVWECLRLRGTFCPRNSGSISYNFDSYLGVNVFSLLPCAVLRWQVPVPALKEQIALVTGVLSEQQRLICRGKVLKDDQLLSAYRILFFLLLKVLVIRLLFLTLNLKLLFCSILSCNIFTMRYILAY